MLRSNTWAQIWSVVRVLAAGLIAAAIVRQLANTLEIATTQGRDIGVTLVNFFSYYTILSNLLSVIVLLWAALWFWFRRRDEADEPPILARVLAATTTYMIITGIVYNTLLRGIPLAPGTRFPGPTRSCTSSGRSSSPSICSSGRCVVACRGARSGRSRRSRSSG